MTASIFVRFDHVGFHRWPAAPDHRKYLRELHRHLFKVTVIVEVEHDDREIEFHDVLDLARNSFVSMAESASCETMARAVAGTMVAHLKRPVTVIVSEDGECGAVVEQQPKKEPGPKARPNRRRWPISYFLTMW